MPALLTWLVRQGVVQTEQGARSFTATLRVPASWLAQQPTPPASDAAASAQASPLSGPLNAAFAGKAQALQTGSWALLLQSAGAPGQRTSALLTLDFQPLAAPTLYGRELLHVRNDPWLLMAALQASGLVGLRFVDNRGQVTEQYPANPNGAPAGITAVTTTDGRATIMMPHPERVFRTVANSWHPDNWGEDGAWMRMFRNARVRLG